jgi:subtilisin family serine protease
MSRKLLPIVLLFVAASLRAAEEPRARYLVATTGETTSIELPRGARMFRSVNGFAAELTPSQVARLRRSPYVRSVELDPVRRVHGFTSVAQGTPFRRQSTPWGITAVNAPSVWRATRGAGVKVAVIDTGIDLEHADLIANYKGGYDFVDNDSVPEDESNEAYMHGTLMAGVIAAADNAIGLVGVAPEVELYALKIFDHEDNTHSSTIIAALDWAIANGIQILSCSFGGEGRSELEEAAYRKAAQAGIVIVASTGNDAKLGLLFPAAYDGVIAVGAINEQRAQAAFSNWGPQVDFVAPGVDVVSTAVSGKATTGGLLFGDGSYLLGSWLSGDLGAEVNGALFNAAQGSVNDFSGAAPNAISIVSRGLARNDDRVANARAAGAAAVVFVNNQPGACNLSLNANTVNPPAICVSQEDGALLRARAGQTAMLGIYADDYKYADGTSMSVPHVAGAAALLLALKADVDVEQALQDAVVDLGAAGWDERFGYGLIDVGAAARRVAPQKFTAGPKRRSARH